MRRWSGVLFAALALAPGLSAQEAGGIPRAVIAVVDLTRVSDESMVGKELARQLGELQQELEGELNVRRSRVEADQAAFQADVASFQAAADTMADGSRQAREAELVERQQGLQELIQAARVDADAAQRRLQNEIQRLTASLEEDIRPHMNAVADSMGVDVLLPLSQTVFHNPALDITDQVIARVDAAYQSGNGVGSER